MYQAGIYCRVSIEEIEKQNEYSNSIHSQLQMADDYITTQTDILKTKVYIDDGVSGSNFNRPEFRRMLADIELGTINMIIIKDVSRLGREHIDTNYYLGKYFPERRVRVVSLLDHYDSVESTYDELLEIKTLINDMYLRDASRKIKTALKTKRGSGEYTQNEPPFGYFKSKELHNHLEIDPYAANIVKRIYNMYLSGHGCKSISTILNEESIPAPAKYKKEVLKADYAWDTGKGLWHSSAVAAILKNPVYTGAVVLRKFDKPSYKLEYRKQIPLEELELAENAHEPIISKEDFEQAQTLRKSKYVSSFDKNKEPHKYVGILFCGRCKMAMKKRYLATKERYDGYMCGFHQKMGEKYCTLNHISFEKLDELVTFAINQQMHYLKTELKNAQQAFLSQKPHINSTLARLETQMNKNREYLKKAYEQFMDDILSKNEYLDLKQMYEQEIRDVQAIIAQTSDAVLQKQHKIDEVASWLGKFTAEEITAEQLNRDFLLEVIDKIYVYPEHEIDIHFKVTNPLEEGENKYV